MKEYPDSVMLYMSNYRLSDDNNLTEAENVEDTVRIYGIVEEPVVMRRANQRPKRRRLSVVFSRSSIGLRCEMTLLVYKLVYKSIVNIK